MAEVFEKIGEIPYDFVRKRLTVICREGDHARLITKGAFDRVLACCTRWREGQLLDQEGRKQLEQLCDAWSVRGIRVLGVAERRMALRSSYGGSDESELEFLGFLTFADQPKSGIVEVLSDLKSFGVSLKIITGDNRLVAQSVAESVGLNASAMITSQELDDLRDEALWQRVSDIDVFAQVDPNQKERIILALKKRKHIVCYMGDGVNDAPAMHAADVSISVDTAVDVAKSTASFVLTEKDLKVICGGIAEGRKTFANTMKFVLLTMSANLGNMISMALSSLVLPYLLLTAGQILLNNLLSDLPLIGLADDSVDRDWVSLPHRWRMGSIRRFMVQFGLISSCFDMATFALLLWGFSADVETFRTGWFVESLLSELAVVFALQSQSGMTKSIPGTMLWVSSIVVAMIAISITYLPVGTRLGFVPLSPNMMLAILSVIVVYVATSEFAKQRFFRKNLLR